MARLKIYTKKGDRGETSLIFGHRVSKDHPRIMAVGAVDELNASLGVAVSFLKSGEVVRILEEIQNELFNIGAEIASPKKLKKSSSTNTFYTLEESKVTQLESFIDRYEEKLAPLQNFILPGGTLSAAHLHLSRTVARRAERTLVTVNKKLEMNGNILKYLNRLSDLLFVLARHENKVGGSSDKEWQKD